MSQETSHIASRMVGFASRRPSSKLCLSVVERYVYRVVVVVVVFHVWMCVCTHTFMV